MTKPIVALSAREMVRAMQTGALGAAETMAAHFEMIEAREPSIRAWAFLGKDGAMEAASRADAARRSGLSLGPLHGLPVAVKDIIDTYDMPTGFGARLHAGRRPAADATIVARLRAAGAIVMGKVVTAEYALFVPGPTRNPHDLSRSPGGSSMGSAAAVAAHMAPVALATQTKGSIIRPAITCGVVGYKPSLGLLPRTGILRQSPLLDQPGVMARDVADAAFLIDAISGRDDADELSLEEVPSLLSRIGAGRSPPRLALVGGRAPGAPRNEPARKSDPLPHSCRRGSPRSSSRPSSRPRSRRLTSCCAQASPSPSGPTSKGGETKWRNW